MSELTTSKSAGFTQIASALSAGEFQSFEAVQAQIKTAKYYESEELWVINVEYLGEYYTLRPDTQTLPLNSTAQELLDTVQSLLTQINKRKPTASREVKTVQQQVINKRAIDFAEKRPGLQLDLIVKTKIAYTPGQLVYNVYNGYIDEADFKNGYVNLDKAELLASYDASDISTDELAPTTQLINKEFADGSVITFIATEFDAKLGSNVTTYAAYVKLAPSKDPNTINKMIPFASSNSKFIGGLDGSARMILVPPSLFDSVKR
jgi:hypothetical protein